MFSSLSAAASRRRGRFPAAHVQETGLKPGRGLSHPLLLRHCEQVTKPLLNKLVLSKRWIWHFQHKTLAEVAKP